MVSITVTPESLMVNVSPTLDSLTAHIGTTPDSLINNHSITLDLLTAITSTTRSLQMANIRASRSPDVMANISAILNH